MWRLVRRCQGKITLLWAAWAYSCVIGSTARAFARVGNGINIWHPSSGAASAVMPGSAGADSRGGIGRTFRDAATVEQRRRWQGYPSISFVLSSCSSARTELSIGMAMVEWVRAFVKVDMREERSSCLFRITWSTSHGWPRPPASRSWTGSARSPLVSVAVVGCGDVGRMGTPA